MTWIGKEKHNILLDPRNLWRLNEAITLRVYIGNERGSLRSCYSIECKKKPENKEGAKKDKHLPRNLWEIHYKRLNYVVQTSWYIVSSELLYF